MSSHHYVKEGQEPALIIGNGAECRFSLLQQLMEWSPIVIALDGAYQRLKDLQVKPDIVIGDFDSIGEYEADPDITYIKIEDQETTDLEKGLNYLLSNDFKDVNLIWSTGYRLDHTLSNISVMGKYSQMNIVLYDNHSKAYILPPRFEKHYEKGDTISLLPLGKVGGIKTENLLYPLNDETLEITVRSGSSNEVKETGLVKISHGSGKLLMIEKINEAK